MDEDFDQLKALFEEMHKALDKISTAQSNYTMLKEIKEYYIIIQNYFDKINKQYSDHIQECSSHTIDIQDIKNQIEQINTKIDNLPSLEDIDFSSIINDISNLQSQIDSLSTKLNDLTTDSTYTIKMIETEISNIQTELASFNSVLDDHSSRLDQIDISLGTHQTSIQNLTTTQSNLTTTTNNLSSTVSSLGTRLTNAENEINALNGGIDLTDLNNRVDTLEEVPPTFRLMDSKTVKINKTFVNVSQHKPAIMSFHCNCQGKAYIHFNLKFSVVGTNPLYLTFSVNNKTIKSYTLLYNDNRTECDFYAPFEMYGSYLPVHFVLSSGDAVTINDFTVELFCKNASYIEYQPDYKVCCFNNEIYLTRKTENSFQFGKFTMDTISLTEFPYEVPFDYSDFKPSKLMFVPISSGKNGTFESVSDGIIVHDTETHLRILSGYENGEENVSEIKKVTYNSFDYDVVPTSSKNYRFFHIRLNAPSYYDPINANYVAFINLANYVTGYWSFVTDVVDNYKTVDSSYISDSEIMAVALNEDGYFYFLPQRSIKYVVKLGRGTFATAYKQQDGSINVYISNNTSSTLYKLTKNNDNKYECTEITVKSPTHIYELFDNKGLVRFYSSGNWFIRTV